jgi:hypothetical protein
MNSKYMVIVVAMAVMLIGATALVTDDAFAGKKKYGKNQAISQANACGNGKLPMYVFCQNTGSQVQGENNGVALAGAQQSEEDRRGGGHDGGYDSKDQSAAAPSADQSANIAPPADQSAAAPPADQSAAAPPASEGGDGGYDDAVAPGTEATTGMNEHSNE